MRVTSVVPLTYCPPESIRYGLAPPSGALVFGAGTVYWPWGLSDNHDLQPTPSDPRVQQAMVNLLADMGIQPGTLQSGMVAATA